MTVKILYANETLPDSAEAMWEQQLQTQVRMRLLTCNDHWL